METVGKESGRPQIQGQEEAGVEAVAYLVSLQQAEKKILKNLT